MAYIIIGIIVLLVIIILIYFWATYNGLIRLKNRVLEALMPFVSGSALTEELVERIASLFDLSFIRRSDELVADDSSVRALCALDCPVTTNVLHLITDEQDIELSARLPGDSLDTYETYERPTAYHTVVASCRERRSAASQELTRRGNPCYRMDVYFR